MASWPSDLSDSVAQDLARKHGHQSFDPYVDDPEDAQNWHYHAGQWHHREPWGKWKFLLPAIGAAPFAAAGLAGLAGGGAGEAMAEIGPVAAGGGTTAAAVPPALQAAGATGFGGAGLRGTLLRGGLLGGLSAVGKARQGRSDRNTSPELQRLWQQQHQRQQAQNPLYESILRMAFNRLPTASRTGLTGPSLQQAMAQVPPVAGGDYNEPPQLRELFRDTEVRQQMADPLFQAIQALASSRVPGGAGV